MPFRVNIIIPIMYCHCLTLKLPDFLAFSVKPGHSRILLSNETELVKVVDTRSYVPSPGNENVSPGVMLPGDSEVFCSPSAVNVDKHRDTHTPRRRVRRRYLLHVLVNLKNKMKNACLWKLSLLQQIDW